MLDLWSYEMIHSSWYKNSYNNQNLEEIKFLKGLFVDVVSHFLFSIVSLNSYNNLILQSAPKFLKEPDILIFLEDC